MRPLVLISDLAPRGAERVTVSFACRAAVRSSAPAVCTITSHYLGDLASELDAARVPRYELRARRLLDPGSWARYAWLLRRERFDLVHAHGQDAWILAGSLRRFLDVPLVLTRHVLDEPAGNWRERARAAAALAVARYADALVAPSAAAQARLSELAGVPESRIRVIPNGIPLERFDSPAAGIHRFELRRRLGFAPTEPLVLVVAELREGKGHDVLIRALPRLRARVPGARVVFAGSGDREDALRRLASPCGNSVVFLGLRQDIPELLAASDVVVLPSFAEALPTSLIEAAAAGRPVVATRVGGVSDIVENEATGLLVPPGDAIALAIAMSSLLLNPMRAQAMGERARERARVRFAMDVQIEKTLALWQEVRSARAS